MDGDDPDDGDDPVDDAVDPCVGDLWLLELNEWYQIQETTCADGTSDKFSIALEPGNHTYFGVAFDEYSSTTASDLEFVVEGAGEADVLEIDTAYVLTADVDGDLNFTVSSTSGEEEPYWFVFSSIDHCDNWLGDIFSPQDAVHLPLGTAYSGMRICSGYPAYHSVTLDEINAYDVDIQWGEGADLTITILDTDLNVVQSNIEYLGGFNPVEAGDYLIMIEAYGGAGTDYSIEVSVHE